MVSSNTVKWALGMKDSSWNWLFLRNLLSEKCRGNNSRRNPANQVQCRCQVLYCISVLSITVPVAFQPEGKGKRLPEVYCIVSRLGCFNLFSKVKWRGPVTSFRTESLTTCKLQKVTGCFCAVQNCLVIATHPRRAVLPCCLCFGEANKMISVLRLVS